MIYAGLMPESIIVWLSDHHKSHLFHLIQCHRSRQRQARLEWLTASRQKVKLDFSYADDLLPYIREVD